MLQPLVGSVTYKSKLPLRPAGCAAHPILQIAFFVPTPKEVKENRVVDFPRGFLLGLHQNLPKTRQIAVHSLVKTLLEKTHSEW